MMVFWSLRLGGPGLERQPALAAWYRRLLRRPAFTDVVTAILEADRALSAPVAGAYGGGRWLPGG